MEECLPVMCVFTAWDMPPIPVTLAVSLLLAEIP